MYFYFSNRCVYFRHLCPNQRCPPSSKARSSKTLFASLSIWTGLGGSLRRSGAISLYHCCLDRHWKLTQQWRWSKQRFMLTWRRNYWKRATSNQKPTALPGNTCSSWGITDRDLQPPKESVSIMSDTWAAHDGQDSWGHQPWTASTFAPIKEDYAFNHLKELYTLFQITLWVGMKEVIQTTETMHRA